MPWYNGESQKGCGYDENETAGGDRRSRHCASCGGGSGREARVQPVPGHLILSRRAHGGGENGESLCRGTGHLLRRISPEPDRPLRAQPRDEGFCAELPLPEGHGGRSQRLEGQPDRAAVFAVGPHVGLRKVREGIYRGDRLRPRRVLPWLATTLPETKT